jgi:hypothetical protein
VNKQSPILLSPNFRFRHAAFSNVLKSKVALIMAKTAALRVNFNGNCCQLPSRRGVGLSFSSCHMAKRRVGVLYSPSYDGARGPRGGEQFFLSQWGYWGPPNVPVGLLGSP